MGRDKKEHMPNHARYTLIWLEEAERYELREQEKDANTAIQATEEWWLTWLEAHHSFAFRGKGGHLTLLKEARARGSDYWYAYRSQNRRTHKRYAGRTPDLTFAHLETLARTFLDKALPPEPGAAVLSPPPSQPLLEPKFHPPRLPPGLVARERLFAKMDAGLDGKLTLLCAPAGYGKTTLASQWLNERRAHAPSLPLVWIALDSRDNDLMRFWHSMIAGCQSLHPGLGAALLTQLSAGLSPSFALPSLETVLTSFLNELARAACAGVLVLEDYHLITEARIHETLAFFLDHTPASIHTIILTRSEPPLPLARWRAKGELCEVLAADLCFMPEEAARFFQQARLALPERFSEQALLQLYERVEGWPAGLRLLALAFQGGIQRQGFEQALEHFTGNQRLLQEYFGTEVLNAQPAPVQDFLLRTSILRRLTSSLCDALVGRQDSKRLLEAVERAGLFLESLDGADQWYRYHALFAEAMQAEARRRLGDDVVRSLYLSASEWYAQQKMFAEAIEAAFQAQDAERAASLIEAMLDGTPNVIFGAQVFWRMLESHTLRRWLEQLPQELLNTRPLLCLWYAAVLTLVVILEQKPLSPASAMQLDRVLQLAEDGWRREGNTSGLGEVLAFRAMILKQPGAMREAISYARQALELLSADAIETRIMSLWLVGVGEIQQGRLTNARQALLETRAYYEMQGVASIVRANTVWLAGLDYTQGELQQAAVAYHRLLVEARAAGDIDDICDALLGLAQISYEWNELSTAEQQAQEALELAQQLTNYELLVQATLILARIEHARGDIATAQQRCVSRLVALPVTLPVRALLVREIQCVQARLALAQGDFASLERWWAGLTRSEEIPRLLQDREALLRARWQLKLGQTEAALKMLQTVLEDAQAGERVSIVWETQALIALARAALKHLPAARQQLQELLEHTQAAGYVRLFLDEGEPMATLLQSLVPTVRGDLARAALHRLLLAFTQQTTAGSGSSGSPLSEPLSPQEQRVLQLLTAGHSNPEIARELVVSVNTVKAQVQSIYRKLHVTNRVEASEVARLLKLR